jgi:hypothetical protein
MLDIRIPQLCLLLSLPACLSQSFSKMSFASPPQPVLPSMLFASTEYASDVDKVLVVKRGGITKSQAPSNFQYRITCDPALITSTPWLADEYVAKKISFTTCADLLQATTIRVLASLNAGDYVDVNLVPVPSTQVYNGVIIDQPYIGVSRNKLSACCSPSQCPESCLQEDVGATCSLEINVAGTRQTQVQSVDADFVRFFTGQTLYSNDGAALYLVYKTPCLYCPVRGCNTTCANGEYASDYLLVKEVIGAQMLWTGMLCDPALFCRGSISKKSPAPHARPEPGIRVQIRRPATGKLNNWPFT